MRERRSYDRPAGHPWATQSPGGPQHLPDLVLQHPHSARPIAVEVELTRKAPDRLAKLLDGYALSRPTPRSGTSCPTLASPTTSPEPPHAACRRCGRCGCTSPRRRGSPPSSCPRRRRRPANRSRRCCRRRRCSTIRPLPIPLEGRVRLGSVDRHASLSRPDDCTDLMRVVGCAWKVEDHSSGWSCLAAALYVIATTICDPYSGPPRQPPPTRIQSTRLTMAWQADENAIITTTRSGVRQRKCNMRPSEVNLPQINTDRVLAILRFAATASTMSTLQTIC